MLARVAVALVAVLALGWLGVLYRDQRVASAASDRIFYENPLPPAEFERQIDRLRGAPAARSRRLVEAGARQVHAALRPAAPGARGGGTLRRKRAGQHRGVGSASTRRPAASTRRGRVRRRPRSAASIPCPPTPAADRHRSAALRVSSLAAISPAAIRTTGRVTAGISQSQSIEACRSHTVEAAQQPAASGRPRMQGATPGRDHAAEHHEDAEQARQAQLGSDAQLERVDLADALAHRALAQPFHAKATGAEPLQRLAGKGIQADAPVVVAARLHRRQPSPRGPLELLGLALDPSRPGRPRTSPITTRVTAAPATAGSRRAKESRPRPRLPAALGP